MCYCARSPQRTDRVKLSTGCQPPNSKSSTTHHDLRTTEGAFHKRPHPAPRLPGLFPSLLSSNMERKECPSESFELPLGTRTQQSSPTWSTIHLFFSQALRVINHFVFLSFLPHFWETCRLIFRCVSDSIPSWLLLDSHDHVSSQEKSLSTNVDRGETPSRHLRYHDHQVKVWKSHPFY